MQVDLRPHFKHLHWRPMPHSFGIDIASDWADEADDDPVFGLYKRCGLWTMDEANILHECARRVAPGAGLDVGAHTGWTTAHMAEGGLEILAIDPMLRLQGFHSRFAKNMSPWWIRVLAIYWKTSNEYFADITADGGIPLLRGRAGFSLICIDGDHESGKPLEDAINASACLDDAGVILLHDFVGEPVREAVTWLMNQGFKARIYLTVHCVAVCWRGNFVPPEFIPDLRVLEQDLPARMPDFDWSRCV